MKPHLRILSASAVLLGASTFLGPAARAHSAGDGAPPLHVGDAYDSCYFDLHPELTQGQFRTFTAEGASLVRFQQLASAQALGAGTWSLSVGETATPIDDAKGAWNNTFSHPDAEHYLGDVQTFPRLIVRYGVDERLDVGAWGSVNPLSNYGFIGLDAKLTLADASFAALPVHLAVRPSVTTLVGPEELWFGNAGVDLTAGLTLAGLSPYVGVGGTLAVAVERTKDVDLDTVVTLTPVAVTGLTYRVWRVHVGAEATWSNVHTYGVILGVDL